MEELKEKTFTRDVENSQQEFSEDNNYNPLREIC